MHTFELVLIDSATSLIYILTLHLFSAHLSHHCFIYLILINTKLIDLFNMSDSFDGPLFSNYPIKEFYICE